VQSVRSPYGLRTEYQGDSKDLVLNGIEKTKGFIVGRVQAMGTDDRRNKHQETFVHVVAGAKGAPARHHFLRTLKSVDETYSSTEQVSK
jgi:hypothetical protein